MSAFFLVRIQILSGNCLSRPSRNPKLNCMINITEISEIIINIKAPDYKDSTLQMFEKDVRLLVNLLIMHFVATHELILNSGA
jgi:hypothetical protein